MDTKEQVAVLEAARLINDSAVLPRADFRHLPIKLMVELTGKSRQTIYAWYSKHGLQRNADKTFDLTVFLNWFEKFTLKKATRPAAIPEKVEPGEKQKKTAKRQGRPPKAGEATKRSDYKGVGWEKKSGKWRVLVTVAGKQKWGGYFDDELAAAAKAAEMRGDTKGAAARNQPCPCGSGKKFKKCCMNLVR